MPLEIELRALVSSQTHRFGIVGDAGSAHSTAEHLTVNRKRSGDMDTSRRKFAPPTATAFRIHRGMSGASSSPWEI
jgi:hypothetical protein